MKAAVDVPAHRDGLVHHSGRGSQYVSIADRSDLAVSSTWCPKGTPMEKLVSVKACRWAIEDSFETAKNELGLDHNETRSWHG